MSDELLDNLPVVDLSGSERPATDEEKLCCWAEFYFLVTLADAYLRGEAPEIIEGVVVEGDGGAKKCYVIQKGFVEKWESDEGATFLSMKAGYGSGLVVAGEGEGMIVLPSGDEDWITGRAIRDDFLTQVGEMVSGLEVTNPSFVEYANGGLRRIEEAKKRMGVSSNVEVFARLKQELVANYQSGLEERV